MSKKIMLKVGSVVSINGYDGDALSRPVVVEEIDKKSKTILCKCLVLSSGVKPVYRRYSIGKIGSVSLVKVGRK